MRTITINDTLSIIIEALTRRSIEKIKEAGHEVSTCHIGVPPKDWDSFSDELVRAYISDDERADKIIDALKDVPKDKYRAIVLDMISETWGSEAEEKN